MCFTYDFQGITCFTLFDFKKTTYENYVFPVWAEVIGALLALLSFLVMPGVAIYKIFTVEDKTMTFVQVGLYMCEPWGSWSLCQFSLYYPF